MALVTPLYQATPVRSTSFVLYGAFNSLEEATQKFSSIPLSQYFIINNPGDRAEHGKLYQKKTATTYKEVVNLHGPLSDNVNAENLKIFLPDEDGNLVEEIGSVGEVLDYTLQTLKSM